MQTFHLALGGLVLSSSLALGCGDDGARGAAGGSGSDGQNGSQGEPGQNGENGAPGENGGNGAPGENGENGAPGENGENGENGEDGRGTSSLGFADVGFARTNAEKHAVRASTKASINGVDLTIGFHGLIRSGEDPARENRACDLSASPATCAGALLDKDGALLRDDAGEGLVSNQNDFSSLLEAGDERYLVHSFESYPASLFLTTLAQDDATGALSATATKSVDLSSIDGLYRSCAGSITPWHTHISAEESQVDAHVVEAAATWTELVATSRWGEIKMMARYLGLDLTDGNADNLPDLSLATFQSAVSSYFWGYAVELGVAAGGATTVEKHYAMGRLGMELAYVMPDDRTVYLTDDVTNGGLFMFVADEAKQLDAGKLYAMRLYQRTVAGGELRADIEWIELGHATSAEIHALLHPATGAAIKFADMFEIEAVGAGPSCSAGFTLVRANGDNENLECLKLKPGMDVPASRLETRRYAVLKGATAELTKEEGLTYDKDLNRIYIALSDITASMAAQVGGDNHIDVAANRCGGVFALDVGPWVDAQGLPVSEYAALNWYPLVMGSPVANYPASSPYTGNSCAVGGLASPDNVTYLPKYETLVIGEDTGRHQNDAMWTYHLPSGRLTRILTTPYGSEVTSPYWVPNFGGYGYLITAVQHPYGESDSARLTDSESSGSASWIGVVGPFPALD